VSVIKIKILFYRKVPCQVLRHFNCWMSIYWKYTKYIRRYSM